MAAEFSYLADRADHYRELAAVIRDRVASIKTPAARNSLVSVAEGYEILAGYAESLERTWQNLRRRQDE